MPESTQHKLDRVRPPRVQITYDVEIGDAIVMKELPFVVGIMADLSGDNAPSKPLKDRKYVEIDRDNFNDIMYSIEPKLNLSVKNRLKDAPESLPASLVFKNLDDFSPINVLRQVPEMNELFEARTRLSDLATKLDGNDRLEEAINHALFIGVGDSGKTLDEAIKNASATPTPPPAAETGVEATTPEANAAQEAVAKAQKSADEAIQAATGVAKAKPKEAAAAWKKVAELADVAKADADAAAQAMSASEKAKAEASAALWKTASEKATAAQAAIDAAKGADATQDLKDAATRAIEEATEAATAAAAPKTAETTTVAAPKTLDDAKPLNAKQKREALQKLLTDRKDAAELKEATTYASELKGLEKAVADAEKELKKLRETAKRKARLEGKELTEDGGSDDE